MKIIYYSTAYFASHGGSNHSKSFVECCSKHSDVDEVTVFPPNELIKSPTLAPGTSNRNTKLFSFLKRSSIIMVFRFFRRSNFYLGELFEVIAKDRPNAIVIRLDGNFRQVTKLRKKFPRLVIATEVNASPFDESFKRIILRSYFQWLERHHLSRSDLNFFVSKTLRNKIMGSKSEEQRDVVLPNGVDIALFSRSLDKTSLRKDLQIPLNKRVIGYVGTLDISKRMDLLIDAFAELSKMRKDIFFIVVGGGPDLPLTKTKIAQRKLSDDILLTGAIPHSEVPKYLQTFDIAIHHAANDYMCPLKLFEYLAARLPVVGPDTPAVREIFEDDKHLILCRPTVESILEKLNQYLNDLPLASKLAEEGMKLVSQKYTWQINANTVINKISSKLHK